MKTNIERLRILLSRSYATGRVIFLEIIERPRIQFEFYFRICNKKIPLKIILGLSLLDKISTLNAFNLIKERLEYEV